MPTTEKVVFSGVQPTGSLHLGNYIGAIRNFINLQKKNKCLYCIVDLHSLTENLVHTHLMENIEETAAAFLAAGINPQTSIIFRQSQVSQHAELAWIFNCVARIGWLNRMTQFKEKSREDRENASLGLFAYPNLMAADILLYRATHVPVGEDQKQHLELTRDIAKKFNHDFFDRIQLLRKNTHKDEKSGYFPMIEGIINQSAARIMSLRDGTKKMSKSESADMSRINLTDNADTIAKKIQKAKTDTQPLPETLSDLNDRPEAKNLIHIYAEMSQIDPKNVLEQFSGANFSRFKKELSELIIENITPIGKKMQSILADKRYIETILDKGSKEASLIAKKTMKDVYQIIGL